MRLRPRRRLTHLCRHLVAVLLPATALNVAPVLAQSPTVTGYCGTQTFVTSVGKDPDEPNACNVVGGSSYWFAYKPPTNGLVSVDSAGSSYNTVLAIYVDNGLHLGYASLLPVTCNDDCSVGILTSCVQFMGSSATNYYIMLDGVNAATGTAKLNWRTASRPSISTIAKKSINEDANTGNLAFTISDPGYPASNLTLTGISTNQTLVATTNIVFGGSGSSRTVRVMPNTNMFGTNYIAVVVTNPSGATNSTRFLLSVASVNDVPKSFPDTVTRLPNQSITIARTFPPRNDTDVEGDVLTLTAVASKSKNGVAITLNSSNIIYAASIKNTPDYFTYTVNDGKGATATGTNNVYVGTNGVPVVY
jgi:hypothetical protein